MRFTPSLGTRISASLFRLLEKKIPEGCLFFTALHRTLSVFARTKTGVLISLNNNKISDINAGCFILAEDKVR